MKVCVSDPTLQGVISRIQAQEDEVVDCGKAEVFIPPTEKLPDVVLQHLGYFPKDEPCDLTLSRWWYGTSWSDQGLIGFPLHYLLPQGLGPKVSMGCVSLVASIKQAEVFENLRLQTFLEESKFEGFVAVEFFEGLVSGIHLGLPFYQWYNVLEAAGGYVSDYLARPWVLPEFWTVSLVLARWPFPVASEDGRATFEVPAQTARHFWPWGRLSDSGRFSTSSTIVGIATSYYNQRLYQAVDIAETTCRNIQVSPKVFFTGSGVGVLERWREGKRLGLF